MKALLDIKKLLLIFLLLFIFHGKGITKHNEETIIIDEVFTIEDGLSFTRVTSILQDHKGYLWVGTTDGLNRYNGYDFNVYRHQPTDSFSISNNYVYSLDEDKEGNIWIATRNGLNKFDRKTGQFMHYEFLDNSNSRNKIIYYVYIDSKGIIWLKTFSELIKFNPSANVVKHYEHDIDVFNYLQGNYYYTIFEDSRNKLWVGHKDGLYFFDKRLEIFKHYVFAKKNKNTISNNRIKTIYEDTKGNLWIGTKYGLNKYNYSEDNFTRYYNDSYESNQIQSVFENSKEELLIGTIGGLYKFDRISGEFINYNDIIYKNRTYNVSGITEIIEDNSKIIWIGSKEGLVKYDLKGKTFDLYKKSIQYTSNFSSNSFSAILVENDEEIWLGTWGGGVNFFNRKANYVKEYRFEDNIYSLYQDDNSTLWAGTDKGLYFFDSHKDVFYSVTDFLGIESDLKLSKVNDIISINNTLWLATSRGLFYYDLTRRKIRGYSKLVYNEKDIPLEEVNVLTYNKEGYLWVGTTNGLVKYFPSNGYCKHFVRNQEVFSGDGLSSNNVYSLLEEDSILWVGTSYGLNKMDKKNETFKLFDERKGMPNNIIYSMEKDSSGNLWISTNKGLARFNIDNNKIKTFDIVDGLQGYEYIMGSSFKTESGELFFGGISGFNAFFPDSISKNKNIPNIVLTSIEVIDEKGQRMIHPCDGDKVVLPSSVKMFTVNFAALDYTHPRKNNYAYKLKKIREKEEEWIHIGNRRSTSFTNLASGKYIFSVKGSNNDNVWNNEGVSIALNVKAPLLRTKFAYYSYFVVIVLLIVLFIRYRTRSLMRSNRILREKEMASKEVARQKEELAIKNKDITDSINYAKRIQEAMMPSLDLFNKYFNDSFVLYKPKSIVSGDFFWISESNGRVYIAAVDCTGHGVPGAFMSLIGIELFRRISSVRGIEKPSLILNLLNKSFADIFSDVGSITLRDGMDVSLCMIDKQNKKIEYAGAFNPLYIVRDEKIIEVKGDRFSVGLEEEKERKEDITFTNNTLDLKDNDILYLFTDGFADQFGGPSGKKYKKRRFRYLLLNIHNYPMEKQKRMLDENIEAWKGNLDQVDDILVIGIKP